jgi:hypothetical protein
MTKNSKILTGIIAGSLAIAGGVAIYNSTGTPGSFNSIEIDEI